MEPKNKMANGDSSPKRAAKSHSYNPVRLPWYHAKHQDASLKKHQQGLSRGRSCFLRAIKILLMNHVLASKIVSASQGPRWILPSHTTLRETPLCLSASPSSGPLPHTASDAGPINQQLGKSLWGTSLEVGLLRTIRSLSRPRAIAEWPHELKGRIWAAAQKEKIQQKATNRTLKPSSTR